MSSPANDERFVSLLTGHQPMLMMLVRALVPNRSDADDIIQEVNLYLWRHADELRSEETFAAWVRQTVRYQVLTYRKKQGRERCKFSEALLDQLVGEFGQMVSQADTRQSALADCLQKLSEKDRKLIVERYQPGTSTQALATKFKRSEKGIYESLARIRQRLFECVTRALSAEELP